MNSKYQLASRLANASALLHKGSVKAVRLTDKARADGKVQASWGSAMRR
jgi:hypothetical protein